jgi:hypothetical protein
VSRYLDRLKLVLREKRLPDELTKPTKPTFVSFVSAQSRPISEIAPPLDAEGVPCGGCPSCGRVGRSSTRSLLPIIGNAGSAFPRLPMVGPAISAVCLIRCCNEEIRVPAEGKTVTDAYLRSITDEDAAAQLRDPLLRAYMLRDPTGAACTHGHGKTRKECEQRAITHAAECAEEAWPESRMWVSSKWQLLIWRLQPLRENRAAGFSLRVR